MQTNLNNAIVTFLTLSFCAVEICCLPSEREITLAEMDLILLILWYMIPYSKKD